MLMEPKAVAEVMLNSGHAMPMLGFGTAAFPLPPNDELIPVFIAAIEAGYRHFDTATLYGSEEPLGIALAQAQLQGLIKNRSEVFVTTKLWCTDAHPNLVLPALNKSLQEYFQRDVLPFDIKGTWEAMEECSKLGLTKSIGVSNFGVKKLSELLQNATIPPALNQVEMNVAWQQGNLRKFCQEKGINKVRMKENLQIFDWKLNEADLVKIKLIPQRRAVLAREFVTEDGTLQILGRSLGWRGMISEDISSKFQNLLK